MSERVRHALLGLVALSLFGGAIFVTWVFLQGGFQGGVPVRAVFADPGVGQQLPTGGDVKIKGVLVGRIADITIEGDYAVIELRLNEDAEISSASSAEIRSKTVFGQKWVELIPPDGPPGEAFVAGDEIPDERTGEPLEFEKALQLGHDLISEIPLDGLATITRTLAEGFTGQEEEAGVAIDRGLKALRAVNSRSDKFDLALRQLNEFSGWLADNDSDLLSFMRALDTFNRAFVGAAPEFISSNRSVPVFLNDLADFQIRVENDLGRLVEDGASVLEIVAARSDRLGALITGLEAFTTVWNSGLSQPCEGEFESDMVCWQVYLLPGLESRGLYGKGGGPDADEKGDPNFRSGTSATAELAALLEGTVGSAPEPSLLRMLLRGARDLLPELWGVDA